MSLPSYSDYVPLPSAIREDDLRRVVQMLDSILTVFGSYRERLKVSEVRLQSMIAALRMDVIEELGRRHRH